MRIVFALLVSSFLFATIGHEKNISKQGPLKAIPVEHDTCCEDYGRCELRVRGADSDDDPSCPCCATQKPKGAIAATAITSEGHLLNNRWTRTATDGLGINRGDSITLTWGFVQDGTNVANGGAALEGSSLISTLDDNFSETNTSADLRQRSWFVIFEGTFDRFAALSGMNVAYEPNDNGATLNGGGRGTVGVVPDIRIGGRSIDGQIGGNTLAFNFFPNSGDMVIDTDNTFFFDANDTGFRNTVAHEFGHGIGIAHLISSSERFLLEPNIQTNFEGPQHSEILAIHRAYGDHFEKGVGNDTVANATPLGDIAGFVGIGMDGSLVDVEMTDEDFVSIDGNTDTDVFSFEVTQDSNFRITLTPLGYVYDLAEQGADGGADESTRVTVNTSELNDLGFTLLDQNGNSVLGIADDNGFGVADSLDISLAPGTYFIEVTGSVDRTQFYSLTATVPPTEIIVSTSTIAPTADLLASQTVGGNQYLVDAARDPGQGQTFSIGTDFTLSAITIQIGADDRGAQGIEEDAAALSLNVYQVPLDPVTGDPELTLDTTTLVGSFSDPTAVTFDATTSDTTPLYLTFDLEPNGTAALGTLSADTLYAFTITSSSTTDPSFRIERSIGDEFADGNGIFTGGNGVPSLRISDDAVFFLQGSGVFPIGDVNCDGAVDFLDISPFIAILGSGTFEDKADIDRNGVVNFLDISPFIAILNGN